LGFRKVSYDFLKIYPLIRSLKPFLDNYVAGRQEFKKGREQFPASGRIIHPCVSLIKFLC
jgi:hypothetical protein